MDRIDRTTQRQAVAAELVAAGWKALPGPALASKEFATAVGPREALAWLSGGNDDSDGWLAGQYWSEGRNALSLCGTVIPVSAGSRDIRERARRFAAEVDAAVAETYAARLLLART